MIAEYVPRHTYDAVIDRSRCRAAVSEKGRGAWVCQCRRKARVYNKWCKQHWQKDRKR